METQAEQILANVRVWADAQATMVHHAEFPDTIGDRQQKALEHEQTVVLDRIYAALGFQAQAFMDSVEGWCVRDRLNKALTRAYELGLEDGKDAHYKALGKNQDAFMGAFLTGLVRQVEQRTDEVKQATDALRNP